MRYFIPAAGGSRKSHGIWLHCIAAADSFNGSKALHVNLIAAIIFIDDVYNDGCSKASYIQETSEAACKMRRSHYEGGCFERRPACLVLAEQKSHVNARWTDAEVDWAF